MLGKPYNKQQAIKKKKTENKMNEKKMYKAFNMKKEKNSKATCEILQDTIQILLEGYY